MIIEEIELNKINGGGIKYGILAGIGMIITFVAGIIDGQIKLK